MKLCKIAFCMLSLVALEISGQNDNHEDIMQYIIQDVVMDVSDSKDRQDVIESQVHLLTGYIYEIRKNLIEMFDNKTNQQDQEIQALKKSMEKNVFEIQRLNASMGEKSTEIQKLTAGIAEKSVEIQTLKTGMTEKSIEIQSLQATIEVKEAEIHSLQESMQQKDAQLQLFKSSTDETIHQMSRRVVVLEKFNHLSALDALRSGFDQCEWTDWMDRDDPSGTGDWEAKPNGCIIARYEIQQVDGSGVVFTDVQSAPQIFSRTYDRSRTKH